jgi:hypothetical protein
MDIPVVKGMNIYEVYPYDGGGEYEYDGPVEPLVRG